MNKKIITEIVTFKITPEIPEEEFVSLVTNLQEAFHMKQRGYIDSELSKGKDNDWAILMHWESLDDLRKASKLMMKDDITLNYRKAIIPTSVKITCCEHIKTWKLS